MQIFEKHQHPRFSHKHWVRCLCWVRVFAKSWHPWFRRVHWGQSLLWVQMFEKHHFGDWDWRRLPSTLWKASSVDLPGFGLVFECFWCFWRVNLRVLSSQCGVRACLLGSTTSPEETTSGIPASVDKNTLGEVAAMKPANFRGSTQMFFSGWATKRMTTTTRGSGRVEVPVYDICLLNLIHVNNQ